MTDHAILPFPSGAPLRLISLNTHNTTPHNTTHTDINKHDVNKLPSPFAPKQHYDDLLDELTHNRSDYVSNGSSEPWFTISSMPNLVDTSIRRCIASNHWKAVNQRRPGYSTVCSAAISLGLKRLSQCPQLDSARDMKTDIYSVDCDSRRLDEAHTFASSWVLGDMDMLTGTKDRKNIQIQPVELKLSLSDTADDLGLPASRLAVVTIIEALKSQPFVTDGHANKMHECMKMFLARVDTRVELTRVIIDHWLTKL